MPSRNHDTHEPENTETPGRAQALPSHPFGEDVARIGEIRSTHPGLVVLVTASGSTRIVDMMVGDPLPRAC